MFSCEYCEIFKNTYFEEDLPTAASERSTADANDLITNEKATGQKLGFKGFKVKESAFSKLRSQVHYFPSGIF